MPLAFHASPPCSLLQPPYHVGKYVNASAIPSHIWTFWADCPPKIILAFIKTW